MHDGVDAGLLRDVAPGRETGASRFHDLPLDARRRLAVGAIADYDTGAEAPKRRAIAAPMPREPPVTITVLSFSSSAMRRSPRKRHP